MKRLVWQIVLFLFVLWMLSTWCDARLILPLPLTWYHWYERMNKLKPTIANKVALTISPILVFHSFFSISLLSGTAIYRLLVIDSILKMCVCVSINITKFTVDLVRMITINSTNPMFWVVSCSTLAYSLTFFPKLITFIYWFRI